jgi:arylsulfatase A-like enzyme
MLSLSAVRASLLLLFLLTSGSILCARPNIVLLVADDLGFAELGCQGNTDIPTPHIDSIARDGVRFTDAYVTAPFCSASRAGFMTGRYQARFGYEFNPTGAHNEDPDAGLPVTERTLGDQLGAAGYTTALIGKWHLGGTAKYHPQRRGFDTFYGFLHEGHYFAPPPYRGVTTMLRRRTLPNGMSKGRWISKDGSTIYTAHMGNNEPDYDANNPILRSGQPVEETQYLTDALTREAVNFIDDHKDRPFFLYLSYNAVHSPLQGADRYMETFAHIEDIHRRIFAAMLANLDDSVGAVLKKIKDSGLQDNTLIVFFSDNGGPTRELTSSNAPLRGEKGQVYEGGLRVPFLMRWPGVIPATSVYSNPVSTLDLFPTACAAAGTKPQKKKYDGTNLLPFLTGKLDEAPHRHLFWRIGDRHALRKGDWKILRQRSKSWSLYNLKEDIGETSDLAVTMPSRAEELIELWETENAGMIDPIWTPRRKK